MKPMHWAVSDRVLMAIDDLEELSLEVAEKHTDVSTDDEGWLHRVSGEEG
jgi:hypothetical protein